MQISSGSELTPSFYARETKLMNLLLELHLAIAKKLYPANEYPFLTPVCKVR